MTDEGKDVDKITGPFRESSKPAPKAPDDVIIPRYARRGDQPKEFYRHQVSIGEPLSDIDEYGGDSIIPVTWWPEKGEGLTRAEATNITLRRHLDLVLNDSLDALSKISSIIDSQPTVLQDEIRQTILQKIESIIVHKDEIKAIEGDPKATIANFTKRALEITKDVPLNLPTQNNLRLRAEFANHVLADTHDLVTSPDKPVVPIEKTGEDRSLQEVFEEATILATLSPGDILYGADHEEFSLDAAYALPLARITKELQFCIDPGEIYKVRPIIKPQKREDGTLQIDFNYSSQKRLAQEGGEKLMAENLNILICKRLAYRMGGYLAFEKYPLSEGYFSYRFRLIIPEPTKVEK